MVGLKILSDCKRVVLVDVWLPTSKVLIFIGVALYITNSYAFTETEDATINADLVLNGVLKKGSDCKAKFTKAGTLCISSTIQAESTLSNAIKACGDKQARVCAHEDIIYACQNEENILDDLMDDKDKISDDILLGAHGANGEWVKIDKARVNNPDIKERWRSDCTAEYISRLEIDYKQEYKYYCCY